MTILDSLSEAQQAAMRYQGRPSLGTLRALARMGLMVRRDELFENDEKSRYAHTDIGRMALLHDAQRRNTAAQFQEGQRVVVLDFSNVNGVVTFSGRETKVVTVSGSRVGVVPVGYANAPGMCTYRDPRNLATVEAVEAAGLMGLVRP